MSMHDPFPGAAAFEDDHHLTSEQADQLLRDTIALVESTGNIAPRVDERTTWAPPGMAEVTLEEFERSPGGMDKCYYMYLENKWDSFHSFRYFLPMGWRDHL